MTAKTIIIYLATGFQVKRSRKKKMTLAVENVEKARSRKQKDDSRISDILVKFAQKCIIKGK